MIKTASERIQQSRIWLSKDVFPLWTQAGIDAENGSFIESLTAQLQPTTMPRRAMVQARQIYSYSEAIKMKILSPDQAAPILDRSVDFLLAQYALPSGAFIYSVDADGKPAAVQVELYTQAFIIFCLARAYEVLRQDKIKEAAKKLIQYLKTTRLAPNGGFTEIKNNQIVFQSNPHMHLFEAVIEWLKVDPDQEWEALAFSIYELCIKKFIDPISGVVAEIFDENWRPLKENGRFVFEPGHQYEWAWLMLEFKKITGFDVEEKPQQLFNLAEKYGRIKSAHFVIDEVWSDYSPKKLSSRFWPQCERIKTAVSLGFADAADQAMDVLWSYLNQPAKGLWSDTRSEAGSFDQNPAKASSLYHIINALSEYETKRQTIF